VAGLREEHGTSAVDITDVVICNIVSKQAVGESAATAMLSSIRVCCNKAFGEIDQLKYEKSATEQIVAKAKQVSKIKPKYTIPVDLGGRDDCFWQQIVQDNEAVEHLPNANKKKLKVKRDTAIVLSRHDSISRSDCETKYDHKNTRECRMYDPRGVLQEQELVSERLAGVLGGDGGWVEHNYRDPKDPLKKGDYSNTVTVRPLRIPMLVDSSVKWLATEQKVAYLCSVRQRRAYFLCLEAAKKVDLMVPGHTWVFLNSDRADGKLSPLVASSIGTIVKKYAERGGIGVGNKSEDPGVKEKEKVSGHFLRGHAGSVAYTLAVEIGAAWCPMLCVDRARHTMESFKKNYCRGVVLRLQQAFRQHRKRRQLRFEEAARL